MKLLFLLPAIILFSFSSPEISEEDFCDQSYTINGGFGCPYNGTTHGWCSAQEFQAYANNVYALEECEAPNQP